MKLDIGLVHRIDRDEVRQALVAGIVYFARRSGCRLVAEGIETDAERSWLQELGVELGQGYLLGRPAPVDRVVSVSAPSQPPAVRTATADPSSGPTPTRRRSSSIGLPK